MSDRIYLPDTPTTRPPDCGLPVLRKLNELEDEVNKLPHGLRGQLQSLSESMRRQIYMAYFTKE